MAGGNGCPHVVELAVGSFPAASSEGWNDRRRRVAVLRALPHVVQQHRMRSDLQEHIDAGLSEQVVNSGIEPNRRADIAPPVLGIELAALERASLDCGNEWNCCACGPQTRQRSAQ